MLFVCTLPLAIHAQERSDTILQRVFDYAERQHRLAWRDTTAYVYQKYDLNVNKRNFALLPVPTMYAVAHSGRREHLAEQVLELRKDSTGVKARPIVYTSTFPHNRRAMDITERYLQLEVYNETMIGPVLLSPFHNSNKPYYRYRVTPLGSRLYVVAFKPVIDNTQLVRGEVQVDAATGRIESGFFTGEYDMIRFMLTISMHNEAPYHDRMGDSELTTEFRFLGNRVSSYTKIKDVAVIPMMDHLTNHEDPILMGLLRPEPLPEHEERIYDALYHLDGKPYIVKKRTGFGRFVKEVLWNSIAENLVERVKSNFGQDNRGYLRLNPLINPLYLGYSKKKGVYYKYDFRLSYRFTDNSNVMLRAKGGYSFKQHHFYYKVPLVYTFDKTHNGYIKLEVGNGNWLSNKQLSEKAMEIYPETAPLRPTSNLPFFKNQHWSALINRDFSDKLGIGIGVINYRRKAVEKKIYRAVDMDATYRAAAPMLEVEIRPLGWKGPIITADYERSIKGFLRSRMEYERWEFDAQYIQRFGTLRSLSYRAGFGFYTLKEENPYFLDFTNFRENNIPGGWDDEWSGEFELLNSDYYNLSKHYMRGNVTYSSPLLLLSRLPYVGRYVEQERIYGSILGVKSLFPYTEWGYGFTNRYFSTGMFVAFSKAHFEGVGFKFGIELFRNW